MLFLAAALEADVAPPRALTLALILAFAAALDAGVDPPRASTRAFILAFACFCAAVSFFAIIND